MSEQTHTNKTSPLVVIIQSIDSAHDMNIVVNGAPKTAETACTSVRYIYTFITTQLVDFVSRWWTIHIGAQSAVLWHSEPEL